MGTVKVVSVVTVEVVVVVLVVILQQISVFEIKIVMECLGRIRRAFHFNATSFKN